MSVDYSKFRTPFFEVSIGDSKGSRMVSLPHHIARLISKVEILETFEEGNFNTISLTFIEGSREPASPDTQLGTEGLYKIQSYGTGDIDMDIAGSLTNRTGILTDLRFSGSGGITFTTNQEKRKQAIDTSLQKNVKKELTTRAYPQEDKKPLFLFQERNQVKIKWGYKEDPATVRSTRAYIITVAVKFPDSGQIETTIFCQDTTASLDQFATTRGIPFGVRKETAAGNSIARFEDKTTEKMIRDICEASGIPCIVSKDLPMPTSDDNDQKIWLAGESFSQFMWRMAGERNAVFKAIPDKETGVDKLYFIKKSDLEKKVLVDGSLLNYRNPGSILKTVDIRVDYGGMQGNAQVGIQTDGNDGAIVAKTAEEEALLFKNGTKVEQIIDRDPTKSTNRIQAAHGISENVAGGDVTGSLDVTSNETPSNRESAAKIREYDQSRTIMMEFTTIGYTRLTPGTVEIKGLGVRYSGKYRILTANHVISSSEYVTSCTATTMALTAGGQLNPKALIEEDKPKETEDRLLFNKDSDDTQRELEKMRGF